MTGTTFSTRGLDVERLGSDGDYRARLARHLLAEAGTDVDHVQLRRVAVDVFPDLAHKEAAPLLARIVGAASTLQHQIRLGRDAPVDADPPPERPSPAADADSTLRLEYPDDYRDMDTRTKNVIIRFCDSLLVEGAEGREALEHLTERYGWPYTDRTFYVGPWKAARLRRRKRDARRAAREAREAGRSGAVSPEPLERTEEEAESGFPATLEDERSIRFSTDEADYSAHRLETGEWAVHVRARLDAERMHRLHSQAAELFFPQLADH